MLTGAGNTRTGGHTSHTTANSPLLETRTSDTRTYTLVHYADEARRRLPPPRLCRQHLALGRGRQEGPRRRRVRPLPSLSPPSSSLADARSHAAFRPTTSASRSSSRSSRARTSTRSLPRDPRSSLPSPRAALPPPLLLAALPLVVPPRRRPRTSPPRRCVQIVDFEDRRRIPPFLSSTEADLCSPATPSIVTTSGGRI